MFLTQDEIRELTRRQKSSAQARALNFMGIQHKRRPDGTLAVLRAHVEHSLGAKPGVTVKQVEPDWEAM